MQIDIYKTTYHVPSNGRSYCSLLVKRGDKPEEVVPEDVLKKLGKLTFKKTTELLPEDVRIALDSEKTISELKEKGYSVVCATIETTISTGPIK